MLLTRCCAHAVVLLPCCAAAVRRMAHSEEQQSQEVLSYGDDSDEGEVADSEEAIGAEPCNGEAESTSKAEGSLFAGVPQHLQRRLGSRPLVPSQLWSRKQQQQKRVACQVSSSGESLLLVSSAVALASEPARRSEE